MKKAEIIGLYENGILTVTTHCLTAKESYNVVKFRKTIRTAVEDIQSSETDLQQEAGIDDPLAFDKRRSELMQLRRRTDEEAEELARMNDKFLLFANMRRELLNEDVEVYAARLKYESWKALQDENKTDKKDLLTGWVEDILEDILWVAPE